MERKANKRANSNKKILLPYIKEVSEVTARSLEPLWPNMRTAASAAWGKLEESLLRECMNTNLPLEDMTLFP